MTSGSSLVLYPRRNARVRGRPAGVERMTRTVDVDGHHYLSNSMSGVMVARSFLVRRQLDHVLTLSVERDHQLTIPAQAVDFKKHLIPSEFGQTACQAIQVTPVRAFDRSQNEIGDRL